LEHVGAGCTERNTHRETHTQREAHAQQRETNRERERETQRETRGKQDPIQMRDRRTTRATKYFAMLHNNRNGQRLDVRLKPYTDNTTFDHTSLF
jgi:hypothetical protein